MTGHDLRFRGVYGSQFSIGVFAYCDPCAWSVTLGAGHDLADLIKLYAEHAGVEAAKTLCIDTLAKLEPKPEDAADYSLLCSVTHQPSAMRCTLDAGHAGDHEAHGTDPARRPYETWPQPADAAAEITRMTEGWDGDLDDSGDDITDALVPDVAQQSDLPAKPAWQIPVCPLCAHSQRTHWDGSGCDVVGCECELSFVEATPESVAAAIAELPDPACGLCGSSDQPMDEVTNSHAPGGKSNECHDLHDCGERAAAAK